PRDAPDVERCQREYADGGESQREHGQRVGIEYRDDDDGGEVVDDRQREQEDLQRGRNPRPEQRQHRDGERDVGGGWYRPAAHGFRIAEIEGGVDERRRVHAAERGDAWQGRAIEARQLAGQHLALDLEADQEEEDRHQPVVDPQEQRLGELQRADL